jgi:hypothetical protein
VNFVKLYTDFSSSVYPCRQRCRRVLAAISFHTLACGLRHLGVKLYALVESIWGCKRNLRRVGAFLEVRCPLDCHGEFQSEARAFVPARGLVSSLSVDVYLEDSVSALDIEGAQREIQ